MVTSLVDGKCVNCGLDTPNFFTKIYKGLNSNANLKSVITKQKIYICNICNNERKVSLKEFLHRLQIY